MTEPIRITIRPLTFLDTYQSAGMLIEALSERDITYQRTLGNRPFLRLIVRLVLMPLFNHLAFSGYGAFVDDRLAGWLYLCGRQRAQYISLLAVHPEWRRRGIGRTLLNFAEEQARALKRQWLGLTAAVQNTPAVSLYESVGFRCAHWRIYQRQSGAILPIRAEGVRFRRVMGLAAWRAHQRITTADLEAGDAWGADILPRFLFEGPARWLGRRWLALADGKPEAYMSLRGPRTHPCLYLAAPEAWWGADEELAAIKMVLDTLGETPPSIDLRLGSAGHHEAARASLQSVGFVEQPDLHMKMFKSLLGLTQLSAGQGA
jgi:ribosomal protein S18 acetylase RimI-like enzyme